MHATYTYVIYIINNISYYIAWITNGLLNQNAYNLILLSYYILLFDIYYSVIYKFSIETILKIYNHVK